MERKSFKAYFTGIIIEKFKEKTSHFSHGHPDTHLCVTHKKIHP